MMNFSLYFPHKIPHRKLIFRIKFLHKILYGIFTPNCEFEFNRINFTRERNQCRFLILLLACKDSQVKFGMVWIRDLLITILPAQWGFSILIFAIKMNIKWTFHIIYFTFKFLMLLHPFLLLYKLEIVFYYISA